MSSPDSRHGLPGTIATYLRPAFELAYRLTCDLDAAGTAADDALIAVAVAGAPRGRSALLAILQQVVAAVAGVGRRVDVRGTLDLSADTHAMRTAVRAAIVGIPLRARAALVLREAFELSSAEIAEVLGVQPAQVIGLLDEARLCLARPAVWRSVGAERVDVSRSSALANAAGSLCARVRAAHHAEFGDGVAPIDALQAQAHREACADCREHRQLIHRARELSALATPPLFPESFWEERRRVVKERWLETVRRGEDGGHRSLWVWGLGIALAALLLWWGGAVLRGRIQNVPSPAEAPAAFDDPGLPVEVDSVAPAPPAAAVGAARRSAAVREADAREAEPVATTPAVAPQPPLPAGKRMEERETNRVTAPDPAAAGLRRPAPAPSAAELHRLLSELPEVSPAAAGLRPLTVPADPAEPPER